MSKTLCYDKEKTAKKTRRGSLAAFAQTILSTNHSNMSDLTVQAYVPSASDLGLTSYKVVDLELWFSKSRTVRAHFRAIARMAQTSPSNIKALLDQADQVFDVVIAKIPTTVGLRTVHLYDSEVIEVCLEKYNPVLLKKFRRFGIDAGLAQMFGVPLPEATKDKSTSEILQDLSKVALDMSYIRKHCETNPGFEREIDSILERDGKALAGSMTIREMSLLRKVAMTKGQAQAVGRLMADSYKTRKELPLAPKVKSSYKQPNGNYQCVWVGSYPIEMLSVFDSACSAFGVLSLSESE